MSGRELDQLELPPPLRAVRVLFMFAAGLTLVMAVATLSVLGADAELVGRLIWASWPGAVVLVIALRLPRLAGSRRWFAVTVVVCSVWVLGALGTLGRGDPRGLVQLLIPVVSLVLLTRPLSRDFFR